MPHILVPKLTIPAWNQGSSPESLEIKGPPESPPQLSLPAKLIYYVSVNN